MRIEDQDIVLCFIHKNTYVLVKALFDLTNEKNLKSEIMRLLKRNKFKRNKTNSSDVSKWRGDIKKEHRDASIKAFLLNLLQ